MANTEEVKDDVVVEKTKLLNPQNEEVLRSRCDFAS
jgi:hypothetical protein